MTFSFCLVLFLILPGLAQAQSNAQWSWQDATAAPSASPTPKPAPKTTPVKPKIYYPKDSVMVPPTPPQPAATPAKRKIRNTSAGPAEKSIAVDAKVSISLCVTAGSIKVNGWDRDEVRAFVDGGSSLGFLVGPLNKQSKKASSITILGYDPKAYKDLNIDECLEGESIELDVPVGTSLTIKSESDISVDSIRKVRAENLSGNLNLRNISESAEAKAYNGSIYAEETMGPLDLFASTGQITVFEAGTNEINDPIRIKSRNGSISLKNVEHINVEVSSISGSLSFTGNLEPGGRYSFTTSSGKILLSLPKETSCKLTAVYGGTFETQMFKDIRNYNESGIKRAIGVIGSGEAILNVTTYNGSIFIKPLKK